MDVSDREPVRFRDFVEMVSGKQASRSGHVFYYDARIAWNVPSHVASDGTRVDIETTPCGKADDDANGFAFEKFFLSKSRRNQRAAKDSYQKYTGHRRQGFFLIVNASPESRTILTALLRVNKCGVLRGVERFLCQWRQKFPVKITSSSLLTWSHHAHSRV